MANHDKYGYVDIKGKVVIPLQFDDANDFINYIPFAEVKKENKYGVINNKGKVIIPFEYDSIGNLNASLIVVEKNDKYGYGDQKGTLVIPLQYDSASSFDENTASVRVGEEWFKINKQGERVERE